MSLSNLYNRVLGKMAFYYNRTDGLLHSFAVKIFGNVGKVCLDCLVRYNNCVGSENIDY